MSELCLPRRLKTCRRGALGPRSAGNLEPNLRSRKLGPESTKKRNNWSDSGGLWHEFGQIWATRGGGRMAILERFLSNDAPREQASNACRNASKPKAALIPRSRAPALPNGAFESRCGGSLKEERAPLFAAGCGTLRPCRGGKRLRYPRRFATTALSQNGYDPNHGCACVCLCVAKTSLPVGVS